MAGNRSQKPQKEEAEEKPKEKQGLLTQANAFLGGIAALLATLVLVATNAGDLRNKLVALIGFHSAPPLEISQTIEDFAAFNTECSHIHSWPGKKTSPPGTNLILCDGAACLSSSTLLGRNVTAAFTEAMDNSTIWFDIKKAEITAVSTANMSDDDKRNVVVRCGKDACVLVSGWWSAKEAVLRFDSPACVTRFLGYVASIKSK